MVQVCRSCGRRRTESQKFDGGRRLRLHRLGEPSTEPGTWSDCFSSPKHATCLKEVHFFGLQSVPFAVVERSRKMFHLAGASSVMPTTGTADALTARHQFILILLAMFFFRLSYLSS